MGIARFGSLLIGLSLLAACGGGSNSTSDTGTTPPDDSGSGGPGCSGSCASATSFLSEDDVRKVIAQAANEAQAQARPAVIAVTDRVGNVLGVYRMAGAPVTVRIGSGRGVVGGVEGLDVPSELAAIAKAVTGAYLSSEGNAFSTRTASQIVQDHFNPGERNTPGGPLSGVQFSQLPCSDLSTRLRADFAVDGGPHRSPLGLSADPGGFPLYRNGVPVGGIGVAADPDYTLDPNILDRDRDIDEFIAWAGSFDFGAPVNRRADRITVEGKTLRFTDVEFSQLARNPASAPAFASLGTLGSVIAVPGYFGGSIRAGTAHGQVASGVRPEPATYPGVDAFVLDDGTGNNRFAPRAGTDGASALSATEVNTLVAEALAVANRARAQIRQPLGTSARVTVSVVDTNGAILGIASTRDAPVFGIDVSLQKARTAMFMTSPAAAGEILARDTVRFFNAALNLDAGRVALSTTRMREPGEYVTRLRAFLGLPGALGDGAIAFGARSVGNLARPFYPDGIENAPPGPFSPAFADWSPFTTGLQLDLVYTTVALHVAFYLQQLGLAVNIDGGADLPALDDSPFGCGIPAVANGIQIFAGGVPVYRGNTLVGGIGISGDGIEQDDMIAFLGLHNAGARLGGAIGNAPQSIRADVLSPQGARLRYVQCPQAPFLDSNETQVCEGK